MIESSSKSVGRLNLGWALPVLYVISFSGCGEFFDQESTNIQNEKIFRDLSQVNIIPDVNIPLPKVYTTAPKILPSKEGVTLFYFTRHHPPNTLAALIKGQLGDLVSKNPMGANGSADLLMVNENPATNQLILKCATVEDADFVLKFLNEVDVPPIQVKVNCLISELFADLTMDYETKVDIQDLLGKNTVIGSLLPGASMRAVGRSDIGLKASISREKFTALIDLLESRGYAKVLMRPTVEVVNGKTARIQIKERIPTPEKILSGNTVIDTVKYQEIMDFLEVTPQVYSDGTIGLRTSAGIASKSPDGVEQIPIITDRQVTNEENRIRKGQSLVIGGVIKTERISVVRGVPLLKDIPGLGILFSGKDFEDRVKEILFILTPSISSNGTEHAAMIEVIKQKHTNAE